MTLSLKIKIAVIIVIQTLVLCAMVAKKQWTLTYGTAILLETRPIDPRSLFRGDYIRIRYNISSINKDSVSFDDNLTQKDNVYVILEKKGKFWDAVAVRRQKPALSANQVTIRGQLGYITPEIFNLKYGIENYFVPEGEGMALERPENNEKVTMRIMVDNNGKAAIKQVLINDKAIYTETLF